MNYKLACKTLDIDSIEFIDEKKLKKIYYTEALRYHPDKYPDDGEKFKQIKAAYDYLRKYMNIDIEESTNDYMGILNKFIKLFSPETNWNSLFMDTTFTGILQDCEKISLNIFDNISKERSIEVYQFLSKHNKLFKISNDLLEKMREKVQKKMKNDNLVILNPKINDLLEDRIYILRIKDKCYYIPLWCNEVIYEVEEDEDLIVKCVCELDKNISIDKNNNIIYHFFGKVQDVFREKSILIKLGKRDFKIPAEELSIKKNQMYVLKNQGMLRVDKSDIYNTFDRGDIYIEIILE